MHWHHFWFVLVLKNNQPNNNQNCFQSCHLSISFCIEERVFFKLFQVMGCWTNINYNKSVMTLICKVFLKLYQVWWGCCIYETYNNPVLTLIFIYPYINDIICKIFFHTCHLFILCCIKQGIFQLFQVVVGLLA